MGELPSPSPEQLVARHLALMARRRRELEAMLTDMAYDEAEARALLDALREERQTAAEVERMQQEAEIIPMMRRRRAS